MFPTLEPQLACYRELEQQLYHEKIAAAPGKPSPNAKDRAFRPKTAEPDIESKRLWEAMGGSEKLAAGSDGDLVAMAEEESGELKAKRDALHAKIEDQILIVPS